MKSVLFLVALGVFVFSIAKQPKRRRPKLPECFFGIEGCTLCPKS